MCFKKHVVDLVIYLQVKIYETLQSCLHIENGRALTELLAMLFVKKTSAVAQY